MVIVGHMSSKSAFGAKNTGQKFLTPKNFWWCRNVCPDSCPGVIFGAGRGGAAPSFSGVGRGGAELKIFGAGAARGSHFPRGRGGAGRASLLYNFTLQLQGKNGQNKPENPQNWNMAKIAPKSDKFTK